VFPVLVFALIRLNRQYRTEASTVEALGVGKPAGSAEFRPPEHGRLGG
jgi:hypothetical protein